jgi:hypothetical protein
MCKLFVLIIVKMYRWVTEYWIYNTYIKTVLEMGNRARELVGDILKASVGPT